MTCDETDALLLEFAEGRLDAADADAVRDHLAGCALCMARLRATRDLLRDLGAARSVDVARTAALSDATTGAPESGVPARLGDFEPLQEIGRGGMGVVYRARQISLGRIVALKVLRVPPGAEDRAAERFRREAHAAAQLHHTNIVPIYAQGEHDGHLYYAMELIDGRPLGDVLRDDPTLAPLPAVPAAPASQRSSGPTAQAHAKAQMDVPTETLLDTRTASIHSSQPSPPPAASGSPAQPSAAGAIHRQTRDYKRLARLMAEVADGLAHAHRQGIIHRDIKPQNLLLGRDDHLHITDFGLARLLDAPGMTLSAELVGTPAYMAPEQLGAGGKAIDARTDIYALGVTLYELLTLRRPFDGQSYDQIITAVLKNEPLPPRRIDARIPIDLETICLRAMEKEPARRFRSADELAAELRRYAGDFPIVSRRIGPLQRAVRWMKRRPAATTAIAAAVLVAILAPLLYLTYDAYERQVYRRAYEVLLDDYRDVARAREQLGWVARFGRQTRERTLVEALARVIDDAPAARELLEPLVRRRPVDREAHYLLAWADRRNLQRLQELVRIADDAKTDDTAAGMFFRGMALIRAVPAEAERSFERARALRPRFAQAMTQQARAINMLLYYRAPEEILRYDNAVSALEAAILLQPDKAYPRYLLALTHMLAAEILAADNKPDRARESFERALAAAREAQRVEPTSRFGFAAEANVHERLGDFSAAIAAWDRTRDEAVRNSPPDVIEREQYSMRLLFWQNDLDRTMRAFNEYVNPASEDALVAFYDVLFSMTAGDVGLAEERLARATENPPKSIEQRALLFVAVRVAGRQATPGLLEAADTSRDLPPVWTPEFGEALRNFLLNPADETRLLAAARPAGLSPHEQRVLIAPAEFFIGVIALCEGRREDALAWLTSSSRRCDDENYCFVAKLLSVKLQVDREWPGWLGVSAASGPARK